MSNSEGWPGTKETKVTEVGDNPDRRVTQEACLVSIYGLELGKKFNVRRRPIIIGRSSKADIQIDQDEVSRNHCKIVNTGDAITLHDMGSTNGTYVNDEVIDVRILRDGDFIKIGGCIFKFLSGNNIEGAYHEEIYRLTTVDGLTQVYNRRYFVEKLEREIGRARRYRRDLSLIMLDIDRFKAVNESFGHLAGDHVLKQLPSMIKTRIRRDDVLARYGGERFAIVLPEIDGYNAMELAEEIRKLVEVAEFKFEDAIISISVSIGVASLRGEIDDALEFIEQAATNLFAAKEGGRNRVVGGAEAKLLLPHPRIKRMLAFREAIIRTCPAGSVLLAIKISNHASLPLRADDALHVAMRRLEDIVFAALGGTSKLVGRGNEQALLLVTESRDDADRVKREITAALANDRTADAPSRSLAFGPPVTLADDAAVAISQALDFDPSGASTAIPGWTQQLALPLGILVRNLFLNRERTQRAGVLVTLHEAITRWLLLWLWSETCHVERWHDQRTVDGKYANHFRSSITVDSGLMLLRAAVEETSSYAHRLHSHHAWQQLFGGELNTLELLADFTAVRDQLARSGAPAASGPGDGIDARDWEALLLQILRAMSLMAAPIVPGKNEHALRNRFEGSAEVLVGDNAVVPTDSLRFSTAVKEGHLYLFAPSSSPIPAEPFAIYERCRECGSKEVFIAESISRDGKYVYWSPSTNHSMVGRTVDSTVDSTVHHEGPPTHIQLPFLPDVLLITAIEEERDALLSHLRHETLPKDDDDVGIFYRADVVVSPEHKLRVLVTMLQGMGPLQASARAMYAAMRWRPRFVLMVGVAGGVSGTTSLGDVIVANQVADYSVGKVTGRGGRQIYWNAHQANAALVEAANAYPIGWENRISVARPESGTPRRHVGVIASGGDVVAYQTLVRRYADDWPKLVGVEMEGGGIATALHQSPCNAGFLMIRGVSDHADAEKNLDRVKRWRPYAADAAASYAIGLLQSGLIPRFGGGADRDR